MSRLTIVTSGSKHLCPQNPLQLLFPSATFGNSFRKTRLPLQRSNLPSYQTLYFVIKDSKASSGVSSGFNVGRETYFQSIKISWPVIVVYLKKQQLEKETVTGETPE